MRCFHAQWNPQVVNGRLAFPTHEEASYPVLLCQRLASIVKDKALQFGAQDIQELQQQLESTSVSAQRLILGMLPRGKKFKPLVSENDSYQKHVLLPNSDTKVAEVLAKLPKGAKVLHRLIKRGELRDNAIVSKADGALTLHCANIDSNSALRFTLCKYCFKQCS